jgi:formylglycine-generating enzyme required for sulfatase activity
MTRLLLLSLLVLGYQTATAQLVTESFGAGDNAFSMDFVTIGNPNNVADTTGSPNPAGAVAYTYNLSKHEVSRDQITKANAAGSLGITLQDMTSWTGNGVLKPATGITWLEAATYANWLNTSTGGTAAYKFVGGTFQLWAPTDTGYNANNMFRNSQAKFVIANSDEWYKGAYGNLNGTWNNFPTGSDYAPTPVASGTNPNTAVYEGQYGPADINNAGGLSAYGTMAQGGNVWEWTETAYDGSNDTAGEERELRGGSYNDGYFGSNLRAADRVSQNPASTDIYVGFRVASVPEPSSIFLLALGGVVMALRRRRA